MRIKSSLNIELLIDGSNQDSMELTKKELTLMSQALGQAVPNQDGSDNKNFLRLMKKVDKLLNRWNEELKELKHG